MFGNGLLQEEFNPPQGNMPERREHARRPVNLRVMVAAGGAVLNGRAENLSAGGAGLRLEENLADGTIITMRFLTPHLKTFGCIDATARILYSALTSGTPPYRIGVKFVSVDAEAKRRIAALVGE